MATNKTKYILYLEVVELAGGNLELDKVDSL